MNYLPEPDRVTFAVYGTGAGSFRATDLRTYPGRYNQPAAEAEAKYTTIGNGDPAEDSDALAKFETALDTRR